MLPGCQFQVPVVITRQKLRVMCDDPEVKEELAPGLVPFGRSNQYDGNIMAEVVNAPQEHPVILLPRHVEVLSVKNKRRREPGAVGEGELVVVGKLSEFLLTNPPSFHRTHAVFSPERTEGKAIQVIGEDGFGMNPVSIDREVPGTGFT